MRKSSPGGSRRTPHRFSTEGKSGYTRNIQEAGESLLRLHWRNPVHGAGAVGGDVEVPRLVLPEGGDLVRRIRKEGVLPRGSGFPETPDPSRAEIPVDVGSLEGGELRSPVDHPPGDRASLAVVVLRHGQNQSGVDAGGIGKAVGPLHHVPPVVFPSRACRWLEVDLLELALPHVADVEVTRCAVEREAPGVAKPRGPDLFTRGVVRKERVACRNGVRRLSGLHVDPQDLPEKGVFPLPVILRIPPASP